MYCVVITSSTSMNHHEKATSRLDAARLATRRLKEPETESVAIYADAEAYDGDFGPGSWRDVTGQNTIADHNIDLQEYIDHIWRVVTGTYEDTEGMDSREKYEQIMAAVTARIDMANDAR